jgi:hypothetical protein
MAYLFEPIILKYEVLTKTSLNLISLGNLSAVPRDFLEAPVR